MWNAGPTCSPRPVTPITDSRAGLPVKSRKKTIRRTWKGRPMEQAGFAAMRQSIVDGAPEQAGSLARQAVAEGVFPLDAIDQGFVPGMTEVGELYAQRQMFLPDMLASAEAMRAAMLVLEPELKKQNGQRPRAGCVVLG